MKLKRYCSAVFAGLKGSRSMSLRVSENLQKIFGNAAFHQRLSRRSVSYLVGLAILIAVPASAATAACDNPQMLRFSVVPEQGATRQTDRHQGLSELLARKIGIRVELVRPTSYGSVVDGLVNARLDLAILGPASYVSARKRDSGIVPFASHQKKGGAFHTSGNFYQSVLISRGRGPIESLDQMRGARLALTDPGSTSGALLPRQAFRTEEASRRGADFERYFGSIVYAGDHRRAVFAVLDGVVDGAYVADDVLSTLVDERRITPEDVRVVWRSAPIPRDPYVYRQALCEPLRKKIRDAFLSLNPAEHREVLEPLGIVAFRAVSDDDYREIYQLFSNPIDPK
jgi:phosphonate transport system substrate-binding protein